MPSHRSLVAALLLAVNSNQVAAQGQPVPNYDQTRDGFIVFHPIRTDAEGKIIPWYSTDRGAAYDHVLRLVWEFWINMRHDQNGLPYYMNHQVWRPNNDPRGLGGDQLNMALSSWRLLYMYLGDQTVMENMKFIADYYLTHSLSPSDAEWPDIPYPYNTLTYSGYYDGDMILGQGYTQPDKAGNFGSELVSLYKITGNHGYLDAAIKIANTLARHTKAGDADNSPMPFKVNALTGEVGALLDRQTRAFEGYSSYSTGWSGTLELFEELQKMQQGNPKDYQRAHGLILDWMNEYPLQTNRWGPFFEDVAGWSDTQINAVTFARYMMLRPELFPDWEKQARGILDWVYTELGNDQWKDYGVITVNEQTAYRVPGNSHSSRQAAAELQYAALTGDQTWVENAIRQLDWATYMVADDGKNNYPRNEVWLTDGYGDYVRHYLRAMADHPALAPAHQNHMLHSTSEVSQMDYAADLNERTAPDVPNEGLGQILIDYRTYDRESTEVLRLTVKPSRVRVGESELREVSDTRQSGWHWQPMETGGLLTIHHRDYNAVTVYR